MSGVMKSRTGKSGSISASGMFNFFGEHDSIHLMTTSSCVFVRRPIESRPFFSLAIFKATLCLVWHLHLHCAHGGLGSDDLAAVERAVRSFLILLDEIAARAAAGAENIHGAVALEVELGADVMSLEQHEWYAQADVV